MNQSGIFPRFYYEPFQNKAKSDEAGRPIFDKREMVEIHIAGDNKSVTVAKVTDTHRHRWPQQYEAFKREEEIPIDGTPINEWPALSVTQVAEMKALNIHTVEALADLRDAGIQRLGMGGRQLVAKAKAYIEAASGNAGTEKLAAENETLKDRIALLESQLKELNDRFDSEKARKKPGPKPKTEAA